MASSNRAAKSGIALDAQKKLDEKWDSERAKNVIHWIGERIGTPLTTDGTREDVQSILKNGCVLGALANWIKPGTISAAKLGSKSAMAFKQMELIGMFIDCIDQTKGGLVKKDELFQTVDLYDGQNVYQVILTIEALGRALLGCGREGFGKAESKGQHHDWSEEQLNAGKGIIGLQMGSNKGATQAGQNFGKSRDIMS